MTINVPSGNLGEGLKNLHVSVPALLAAGGELIRLWAPAWYAAHEQAIQGTQKCLIAYAAIQASSAPAPPAQPATKPEAPKAQ